jgi:hypothetical protein
MKDHIGADDEYGLVNQVTGTSTNQQGILKRKLWYTVNKAC